jgi:hypothetical protein
LDLTQLARYHVVFVYTRFLVGIRFCKLQNVTSNLSTPSCDINKTQTDNKKCHVNGYHVLQIYSEMIGNVMTDARSSGKYYHCKLLHLYRSNFICQKEP